MLFIGFVITNEWGASLHLTPTGIKAGSKSPETRQIYFFFLNLATNWPQKNEMHIYPTGGCALMGRNMMP
jgi:hypothetical protein